MKIGRLLPKVAEALLVALRQSLQQCGRGMALGVEGCLIQSTVAMIEAGPVLEEPSLAANERGAQRILGSQHRIPTGSGDGRKSTPNHPIVA